VPPNQAELMYNELKDRGIPTALVLFEGEQHGFRQAPNIRRACCWEPHTGRCEARRYAYLTHLADVVVAVALMVGSCSPYQPLRGTGWHCMPIL
jgi:hypothetical protein